MTIHSGAIDSLFLKPAHREPMAPAESVTAEAGKGLVGDLSYGRTKRQILLVESETLDEYGLTPGETRENITTRGIRLAGIPPGSRIRAGDSVLEVTMDCAPCRFIDSLEPGLQARMEGRRGTLCRVIEGGTIRRGDSIVLEAADETMAATGTN